MSGVMQSIGDIEQHPVMYWPVLFASIFAIALIASIAFGNTMKQGMMYSMAFSTIFTISTYAQKKLGVID